MRNDYEHSKCLFYLESTCKLLSVENVSELGKSISTCGVVMAGGHETNFSPKMRAVFHKHVYITFTSFQLRLTIFFFFKTHFIVSNKKLKMIVTTHNNTRVVVVIATFCYGL